MDVIRRHWRLTVQAISGRGQQLRERLRFGIAARQIAAFVCVGVLVLAANFIVEQGVLIERTTEIVRQAPPQVVPTLVVAAPKVVPEVSAVPIVQRRLVTSDALLAALEHFRRAAQERTTLNAPETEAEYQRSASELIAAAHAFFSQAATISGKSYVEAASKVTGYRTSGDELELLADSRRSLLNDYSTRFETIYARANASLKGAWKVFGRVLARQSLVQLSADLDVLRRSSSVVGVAASSDAPEIEPLLKAEQSVLNDLQINEKGLARSEGALWYAAMRNDLTQLMTLRDSILQANSQLRIRLPQFEQGASSLARLIPTKVESSVVVSAPAKREQVAERFVEVAPSAPAVNEPTAPERAVAESVPAQATHFVVSNASQEHHRGRLIAWISIAVLLMLSLIALGTVLSVIGPVRRLRDATQRLAAGETAVRVQRGGVRELDTLAVAFNTMAEELAVARAIAREYQQGLEAKVVERTHQLQELAVRDPLTGLPNRRQFFSLLNAAIERSGSEGSRVGVYFLDIDNFKYLNDSMGHAFGDRVLVSLARRLHTASTGFGFAARLGGDEFTAVFERAESLDDIELIGIRLVKAFQRPLTVDGRDLIVSVSVGASIYPDHEMEADALLTAADIALFRAKALGRSQLSMFTPELFDAAAARFKTEQGLRHALEHHEFELVFQPEVNTDILETVLVEALIRWRMPDGTLTGADKFLSVAEESGLIMEIGDWVLRTAIEAASQWHHGEWPQARVAINVSPRQLLDNRFVGRVCELLEQHQLPAHCIEIELTESVLQTGAATIAALQSLRAHGVAIALDDFGTGYSSFASLEQLPLTRVKLDRSLIAEIDTNPRSAAIAHAIIAMCQGLGLQITAEGVERPEQFLRLVRQPGMYLQGYLLAPPIARDLLLPAMAEVAQRAQELLLTAQVVDAPRSIEAPAAAATQRTG
jgi:diguanylate cyclase (GGDEF)-like protein